MFAPGASSAVIAYRGWRFGLGICFDLRFPDHWLELAAAGADAFLVVAHMAGADPDPGTKRTIVPELCAVRAAETATPLVVCNTSAQDRHCASLHCDARGMRVGEAQDGMLTATLTHRSRLDPWYQDLHGQAVAQVLVPGISRVACRQHRRAAFARAPILTALVKTARK